MVGPTSFVRWLNVGSHVRVGGRISRWPNIGPSVSIRWENGKYYIGSTTTSNVGSVVVEDGMPTCTLQLNIKLVLNPISVKCYILILLIYYLLTCDSS